jgi:DNA-binding MarR family transcriptional regulator
MRTPFEPPEEDELTDAFWTVARRLRRGSRETLAPFDLSPSHTRALGTLMRHGPMRLSALSEHLHIAARSTTEVVDALQERGLVQREADPTDRRATLVRATDQGWDVMKSVRAARMQEAGRLFDRLDPTDRAELVRILGLLAAQPED